MTDRKIPFSQKLMHQTSMKKNIKVLIVDDEPQNVQVMREILRFHKKFDCIGANSGEEALSILEKYFPEIILLDVMMPGIDGYEVCRQVRSKTRHKFCKIIMISGMSMIDDRLKGYEAGADDYLTKPYVEDELLAKLEVYSKLNRMEEVDSLKTTALSILNHETRTPLNGILLGSDLLRDIEGLPEKAKEYVNLISDCGDRIQELVEKISRYFSIKDDLQLFPSEKHPREMIDNVINELTHVMDAEFFTVHCEENLTFVADWLLLQEALRYIIENSVKNTPDGEHITIDCTVKDDQFILQVRDQGPGVDPSLMDRVFDGLFIPDIHHHRRGTGLSLAIAKEIVEEHGGWISCQNREEGGTLFEILLKN